VAEDGAAIDAVGAVVGAVVVVVDWDADGAVVLEPPAVGALAGGEGAFTAN
jgi:hypothetical protein